MSDITGGGLSDYMQLPLEPLFFHICSSTETCKHTLRRKICVNQSYNVNSPRTPKHPLASIIAYMFTVSDHRVHIFEILSVKTVTTKVWWWCCEAAWYHGSCCLHCSQTTEKPSDSGWNQAHRRGHVWKFYPRNLQPRSDLYDQTEHTFTWNTFLETFGIV